MKLHRMICALGILALGLGACAGISLMGSGVSVSSPSEIPFPSTLTIILDPRYQSILSAGDKVLGMAGAGTVEQRLGRLLQDETVPLRREGADAFRQELLKSGLFGSVVTQGGMVGFSVGVSRFGLAYDPSTRSYHVVLDLEAQLSEPHLGVVWKGQRSVADLPVAAKNEAASVNLTGVLSQPESLHRFNQYVVGELSRQLIEDLRQHPPKSGGAGVLDSLKGLNFSR